MESEQILQIFLALAGGAILGLEREYHNKPAGFGTLILICVSSCLFCILSVSFGGSDRIASNIVTGIGFIGAGVVFKEGANVRGITSAATIWMAAAIGMSIGLKHYYLALLVVIIVLVVLVIFTKFEVFFDDLHKLKNYNIQIEPAVYTIVELENEMKLLYIKYVRNKIVKLNNIISIDYTIEISHKAKREKIDNFFINNNRIAGLEM